MQHKNIIDELRAHELSAQKEKPLESGESFLDEKLEQNVKEAEILEAQAMGSETKNEEVENLCKEMDQLKEQLLRVAAELKNTQARAERDVNNAYQFSLEKFARSLLPVVDNLERALESSPKDDSYMEGVQLTLQLFISILAKFGIEQVNPLNQHFDPTLHEAVSTQQVPHVSAHTITKVFEKGYLLNGRLIRPAKVIITI